MRKNNVFLAFAAPGLSPRLIEILLKLNMTAIANSPSANCPQQADRYELPLDQMDKPDWTEIYGRPGPLIVEIGCGGGRTLINMALAQPKKNFLGIEQAGDYYKILRGRATRRRISNLRIARTDAAYLIKRFLPESIVHEYHIYFPDPWPKRRHRKRRLFTPGFCADLHRTLIPGGLLFMATDFHEYYLELLPQLKAVLQVQEHSQPWEDAPAGRTNYEVKYLKEGRSVYRLIGTKEKTKKNDE